MATMVAARSIWLPMSTTRTLTSAVLVSVRQVRLPLPAAPDGGRNDGGHRGEHGGDDHGSSGNAGGGDRGLGGRRGAELDSEHEGQIRGHGDLLSKGGASPLRL